MVATVLSAQCTDKRVNIVTEKLFSVADTPDKMRQLGFDELKAIISSCGLSNTKAKNILSLSEILCEKYSGNVPGDFALLKALPGVGVKTANVVMANAFGADVIAVDTHVFRVSARLGLAREKTPEKTGEVLNRILPEGKKNALHHALIWHGRLICSASKPSCSHCPVESFCEYDQKRL